MTASEEAMLTAGKPWRGYTMRDLQACADREASSRQRRYPGYVMRHRMTQQQADIEIDRMQAIAEHFAELAEKERLL